MRLRAPKGWPRGYSRIVMSRREPIGHTRTQG
jgi:hypothetical protein